MKALCRLIYLTLLMGYWNISAAGQVWCERSKTTVDESLCQAQPNWVEVGTAGLLGFTRYLDTESLSKFGPLVKYTVKFTNITDKLLGEKKPKTIFARCGNKERAEAETADLAYRSFAPSATGSTDALEVELVCSMVSRAELTKDTEKAKDVQGNSAKMGSTGIAQASSTSPEVNGTLANAGNSQRELPSCQGTDTTGWSNCIGRVTTVDHIYVGAFLNGRTHGFGTMNVLRSEFNGDQYVGEFKNGKFDGQGTYTDSKGGKYVGEHKDGRRLGQGVQTFADGNKYVGEFKDGKRNGQGTFYTQADTQWKGDKYIGEWKDGKYDGQGTYYNLADNQWKGFKFVGEFNDGKRNGRGIFYKADGSISQSGLYKDGTLVTSQYIDPSSFTRIANNSTVPLANEAQQPKNERLKIEFETDRTAWEKELKTALSNAAMSSLKLMDCPPEVRYWNNCFGEFVGPKRSKYLGEWQSGQYDGVGVYTASNGDRYVGQFKANQYHGTGTYYYSNGERYTGEIRDGKKQGQGTLYSASGSVIETGTWESGAAPSVKALAEAKAAAQLWLGRIQSEVISLRQKSGESKVWSDIVSKAVQNTTRRWLDDTGALSIQEIPAPVFPTALSIVQDKWESDKEFEDRLAAARAQRQREIEKIQSTYKTRVEERNKNVQQVNAARLAKERIIPMVRKEFTEVALTFVEPQVTAAGTSFDPKTATLYLDVRIDGGSLTKFEFSEAPVALRKAALTDMGSLKLSAEVVVSTNGEFGLKGVKALAGGASAIGALPQGVVATQAARQTTIELPSTTGAGVLTQQSVLAVDDKQVESILYRDGSDSLRKTLEEQRRKQELALAEESRKAAEEAAKYKAEAKALAELRKKLEDDLTQREQAKKAMRISIQASISPPDVNGEVLITVKTGADTSSLLLNGEELGGRADGIYSVSKVARVGQDTVFTIAGRDINGNTDSKTLKVARQVSETKLTFARLNAANVKVQPKRDAVAIIIGIADYANLPRADYANEDAREFFNYANRGLGIAPDNIKMLIDADAKQLDILRTFKAWLPQRVKPTTDVYVFYSGHGLPSADGKSLYLLPVGTDKDYVDKTAVLQSEINAALQAAKPRSVTLFLDSCYSGLAKTGETLVASARPAALTVPQNAFPLEFTVLSAAQHDQISSSSPELQHGIFSYFLMRGMEGEADDNKDGRVTVGEMQVYLRDQVTRQAGAVNRIQVPQFTGDSERVLVYR